MQSLHKGHQVFLEGHLVMETWEDKNGGGKRAALRVVVETCQYLEPRADGGGGSGSSNRGGVSRSYQSSAPSSNYEEPAAEPKTEEEIPF